MDRSSSQAAKTDRTTGRNAGVDSASPADTGNSSGSGEFVGRAFRKYNESLVRYLSARLHSVRDAEEVAQEAYARMLKLEEPDTISHMQAYLFRIASNIAIDRMRRQGRQPPHTSADVLNDSLPAPAAEVERVVDAQQRLVLIREIIAELPPKCRKAFMLYKFREKSYSEIAKHMNLTESMIRKYVLRAVVYCRARLDDETGGQQ